MNKSLDLDDMESHGFGFDSYGAPIHVRVHAVQHSSLVIMYTNVMMEFNESLLNYHNKCKTILNKQRNLSASLCNKLEQLFSQIKPTIKIIIIINNVFQ